MKNWADMTKKELLNLPVRERNIASKYKAILLVSSRKKHDSGYNLFAVVGCENGSNPTEIAAYMDNFQAEDGLLNFDIDCSMHGVFRLWHRRAHMRFAVGSAGSTTQIKTVIREGKGA